MKESKLNKYEITLGQVENNGMHLISAIMDLSFNQVINMALKDYIKKNLKTREFNALDDDMFTNQIIGERINGNRGVWGYDPEMNDIPGEKKHYLITK